MSGADNGNPYPTSGPFGGSLPTIAGSDYGYGLQAIDMPTLWGQQQNPQTVNYNMMRMIGLPVAPPQQGEMRMDTRPPAERDGQNPFSKPLDPRPDITGPGLPGTKNNIFQQGSQSLMDAYNAFNSMRTVGPLQRMQGSRGFDLIKNLRDVTQGNEMMTGQGADMIRNADGSLSDGRGVIAGSGNTSDYIDTYMNPYTSDVIDRSMQDMVRTNDMMQDANNAQAAAAGAFGGSRHGLTAATISSDLVRNQGNLAAQMRNQGFDTAANLAQGHVAQNMARGNALANIDQSVFNNTMNRAGALNQLQAQDISNRYLNYNNRMQKGQTLMNARQTDNQNRLARNAQNNQTRLGQGQAQSSLADQMFRLGDQSIDRQMQSGDMAQQMNQRIMDAAAQIYDQNGPLAALASLQGLLSGNPLMGESIQNTQNDPGSLAVLGTILGGGGDLIGGK